MTGWPPFVAIPTAFFIYEREIPVSSATAIGPNCPAASSWGEASTTASIYATSVAARYNRCPPCLADTQAVAMPRAYAIPRD